MKSQQLRTELESYVQQLNTQTRVSRQLEYERDRANDDYEFSKVTVSVVLNNIMKCKDGWRYISSRIVSMKLFA